MSGVIEGEPKGTPARRARHGRACYRAIDTYGISINLARVSFRHKQRRTIGCEAYLHRVRQVCAKCPRRIGNCDQRSIALDSKPGDISRRAFRIQNIKPAAECRHAPGKCAARGHLGDEAKPVESYLKRTDLITTGI